MKEIISSLKSTQFLLNEQILWVLKESEIAKTLQTSPLYKHELFKSSKSPSAKQQLSVIKQPTQTRSSLSLLT